MQLVELESQAGQKLWVNPEHVITLAPHVGTAKLTDIIVVGTDPKHPATVKGAPSDIVNAVNAALKA